MKTPSTTTRSDTATCSQPRLRRPCGAGRPPANHARDMPPDLKNRRLPLVAPKGILGWRQSRPRHLHQPKKQTRQQIKGSQTMKNQTKTTSKILILSIVCSAAQAATWTQIGCDNANGNGNWNKLNQNQGSPSGTNWESLTGVCSPPQPPTPIFPPPLAPPTVQTLRNAGGCWGNLLWNGWCSNTPAYTGAAIGTFQRNSNGTITFDINYNGSLGGGCGTRSTAMTVTPGTNFTLTENIDFACGAGMFFSIYYQFQWSSPTTAYTTFAEWPWGPLFGSLQF